MKCLNNESVLDLGIKSYIWNQRPRSGGGVAFLVFLVWMIIVFANNMWNEPFKDWTLDYLITSSLWAFGLVALIGGIPIAIGGIWWLRKQLKE